MNTVIDFNYQLYNKESQYLDAISNTYNGGFDSATMGYATDLHVQKIRTYYQTWSVHR